MTEGARDPYYSEERVRFEWREGDVLVVAPDARARSSGCGVKIESERANAKLEVCGATRDDAERVLSALDGAQSVTSARLASSVSTENWKRVLDATFGALVFAPSVVAALDARVSAAEIVRFPGSPYEIVRSYWENMASVAERLESSVGPALASVDAFEAFLRELHVLALAGASGDSPYLPESPIAQKRRVSPGAFLVEPSIVEEGPSGARFVSGPRVGAGPIGGANYQALLMESLRTSDRGAQHELGRVVVARADADAEAAPWFCPPRPLETSHFESLLSALATANGDPAASVSSVARFHYRFARVHPFPFGNQSFAISVVNSLLRRALGVGIPHHVLDHLALQLPEPAYERVFERAVDAWSVSDSSPVRRTLELVRRKRSAFTLLHGLGRAASLDDARKLVESDREASRLVLLADSP